MSAQWTEQADGTFLGVATARAIEWAETQPRRQDALAQVGFVAWCRDANLDILWTVDDPHVVPLSGFGLVIVLRDTIPLDADPDTFKVMGAERDKFYAVVRIIPTSQEVVIHILGLSGTLDQREMPAPRHHLLSPREWLRAFPQHHVPYTEEAA
jgi:hypothetical protein